MDNKKRQNTEALDNGSSLSPKKTRKSFSATLDRQKPQCEYCTRTNEGNGEEIYQARSLDCGKNLVSWALQSKN